MNAAEVLDYYTSGRSLKECAEKFGYSKQGVHQMIKRVAPQLMRKPHHPIDRSQSKPVDRRKTRG